MRLALVQAKDAVLYTKQPRVAAGHQSSLLSVSSSCQLSLHPACSASLELNKPEHCMQAGRGTPYAGCQSQKAGEGAPPACPCHSTSCPASSAEQQQASALLLSLSLPSCCLPALVSCLLLALCCSRCCRLVSAEKTRAAGHPLRPLLRARPVSPPCLARQPPAAWAAAQARPCSCLLSTT